jgi:L-Ala-D/L-Glu epimerase
VRAVLSDGSTGYGEAAPFEAITGESQASTLAALHAVAAEVTGRDAAEWRTMAVALRTLLPAAPAARCGVEQAVIDAFARHLGISLPAFFGGSGRDLTTDITIPAGGIAHGVSSARRAAAAGFSAVKVKIGAEGWETDVARVTAISQAAPELSILVDANAGYSRADARKFLSGTATAGVTLKLVEQPLPAADIAGLAILEAEFGIPVCADESVFCPADAIRVACAGGISTINVKLMKSGVADALDIISIARSAGMSCMIGGMVETVVSMTFSAALAAANHPLFAYVDLDTPLFMRNSAVAGGIGHTGQVVSLPFNVTGTGIDASAYFPAGTADAV